MDTQAFKRSLHHSGRYNRRGFESPTKRAQALEKAYQSTLIGSIRDNPVVRRVYQTDVNENKFITKGVAEDQGGVNQEAIQF